MTSPAPAEPSRVFARPSTPVAKAMHLLRINGRMTRRDIIEQTGLSQPTVTRAVRSLLDAELVTTHPIPRDGVRTRGRPTVPLELAQSPVLLAGIAVGTHTTYLALYDTRGHIRAEDTLACTVADVLPAVFAEKLSSTLNAMTAGRALPLATVGIAAPGKVSEDGSVTAATLSWDRVPLRDLMQHHYTVPVTVAAAIPALLAAEIQSKPLDPETIVTLYADDSVLAAVSNNGGVYPVVWMPRIDPLLTTRGLLARTGKATLPDVVRDRSLRPLLDSRAAQLADVAVTLIERYQPSTLVIAGCAFSADERAPRLFARAVRKAIGERVSLRMIPTHREITHAITRAIASDRLLRDPLGVGAARDIRW